MRIAAAALVLLMAQGGAYANAAGDPSVQDMIKQLKPKSDADLNQGPHQGLVRHNEATTATPAASTQSGHAAAPARVAAMPTAAPKSGLPTLSLIVPFASGSSELMPSAIPTLQKLGAALTSPDLAQGHFRIEGHTDTVGTIEYNHDLSMRRAETVANYLEKNFGIQADRLQMVGLGFDQPAVATPPETPEPRNRRVQIVNLDG